MIQGVRQQLHRGLAFGLMVLLCLAPFLHGHVGPSHLQGFHMDGLDVFQHLTALAKNPAPTSAPALQAEHEESMALGVASSLPKSESLPEATGVAMPLGFYTFLLALSALAAARTVVSRRSWAHPLAQRLPRRTFSPGYPPPALAPPL
ncbi:MAG: hypothetical protein FGM28_11840 [Limnohabitans sp.]|jgi:hypothetical protein|nr:hypothetical protein [Limnohabitans sp.]